MSKTFAMNEQWSKALRRSGLRRSAPVSSFQRGPAVARWGERMTEEQPGYRHQRWSEHFEEIDREIGSLAVLCRIPLLDPGVIERVLHNDTLVCGTQNQRAFDKLRSLLMLHYNVRTRAVEALGEEETMAILAELVERLRSRFGGKLGGPLA
jgi:hypothetical protein